MDALEPSQIPSLFSAIRDIEPLDFCGEPVPLDSPEVRESLEKEMLLTLWDRAQIILNIKRSGRYFPVIEKLLEKHGMPGDLKYLAVVESALRPHAGSSRGAIGFWQFMRFTGRKYGLTINRTIDERRHILTSTLAAIRYFKALYEMTGSWTLAAAGYNMGENGLKSAIENQGIKDYYRLYLPLETQRYVYKILSVKRICSAPEKFGFHFTEKDLYPPLDFDTVQMKSSTSRHLQIVANAAGTYYRKIKELNPHIRGSYLPRGYRILFLPKGAAAGFQKRLHHAVKHAKTHLKHRIYVVKKGDSLSRIAARFNVPLSALLAWNRLKIHQTIHPGDRLIVKK